MNEYEALPDRSRLIPHIAISYKLVSFEMIVLDFKRYAELIISLTQYPFTDCQVEQKVSMSWVQPRVLDRNQINIMHNRLGQWCKDVRSMEFLLENQAKDILTQNSRCFIIREFISDNCDPIKDRRTTSLVFFLNPISKNMLNTRAKLCALILSSNMSSYIVE